MRATFASMVLLPLLACKPSAQGTDAGAPAASSVAAAPSAPSPAAPSAASAATTQRAEPVPGQYGRFYCDGRRFTAAFPDTPVLKVLGASGFTAVEAQTESNGIGYAVICGPGGGAAFEQARAKAVRDGTLIDETHPKFFGTDAVQVRVALPGGGERMMRLVRYAERFCSLGVEMDNAGDEGLGTKFFDSFRPETPR